MVLVLVNRELWEDWQVVPPLVKVPVLYQWDGHPAKWLVHALLLEVPFPAIAVSLDAARPV